jgi:hypothetical protein
VTSDGRGPLSRRGQQRWSADRQLVELARLMGELGIRRDVKAFGGIVVHDGCCDHPEGPCTCEGGPLRIEPRPPRAL